jgi:4-amino-4-deoxy-L-arabinose transferase-like glycosyltransferase
MVSGLTVAALVAMDRRAGWLLRLRPAVGVPLAVLIVLPWFAAILSIAGTDFLWASVGNDLLGKVTTGQESHWAPPGYHLVLFFVLFLPGPMLVPLALGPAWQARREAAVKFCIAWIVPAWVVFELVATKLPHYTLPLYPAIAMLIAGVATDGRLVTGRWWTRGAILPAAFFVLAFAVAGVVLPEHLEGVVSLPAVALSLAVAALALAAVRAARADQPIAAATTLTVAAIVAYVVVFGFGLSRLDTFRLSPRIAEAVERVAACPSPKLVAAGYQEPSLVFATRTDIAFASGRAAADFLAPGGCRLAVIEGGSERSFLRRAARRDIAVEKVETLTGVSLGRLERLSVDLYRPGPAVGAGRK